MKRSRRLTIANIDFETTVRWQSNVDDDRQFLIGVATVMKRTVCMYIYIYVIIYRTNESYSVQTKIFRPFVRYKRPRTKKTVSSVELLGVIMADRAFFVFIKLQVIWV